MSSSLMPWLRNAAFMTPNCRRHSFIIWYAARPTAFIVIAQKTNASSTPRKIPPSTFGFMSVTL